MAATETVHAARRESHATLDAAAKGQRTSAAVPSSLIQTKKAAALTVTRLLKSYMKGLGGCTTSH